MCGIVGYIGRREMKIDDLIQNAKFNSYRGDDGVGFIYQEDGKTRYKKLLYELDEISKKTLHEWRVVTRKKVGSFEHVSMDDDTYHKENKAFEKRMTKLLNTSSKFLFIHHRKATYGADEERNLHPILHEGKYYIHNGTAYGVEGVKAYLEVMMGTEFKSETDTEVLAILYTKLFEKFKGNKDMIFDTFHEMFPNGWGVLVEIDGKGNKVTLIKDTLRDIWIYHEKGNGMIIVSEPTPFVGTFDSCIKLKDGIISLDKTLVGYDYTEKAKNAYNWWITQSDNSIHKRKCDVCGVEKYTISTFLCKQHRHTNRHQDRCFECLTTDKDKNTTLSLSDKMEIKRNAYKRYIYN